MMKMNLIRREGNYCLVSIGRTTKWIDEDAYETLKAAYKSKAKSEPMLVSYQSEVVIGEVVG